MLKYLNQFVIITMVILVTIAPLFASTDDSLTPEDKHNHTTRLITHFLDKYHYKDFNLNNTLSNKILDSYIALLDPNRSYFYQKDIDSFQIFRFKLDEALTQPKLYAPYQIFKLYQARVDERVLYALESLNNEFDFTIDEKLLIERINEDWAKNKYELDEIWRKRVKNDVLALKLADKENDEIKETLEKRYNSIAKRSNQVNAEDVYQLFINSFTSTLEPHTSYMSPRNSENFEIRMSLSLEGIGALLRTDGEFTVVERVIPGGPAELSDLLHASDRIVGIAQQNEKSFKDVVGWKLEDVVNLIRGNKGTVVKLQILPSSEGKAAKIKEIEITRDKVKLEEQAAKSEIIEIQDGANTHKIGVINVPTFYIDFAAYQRGDNNYRSTTRDVDNLIQMLKSKNIDSLILDLRFNGGGSLTEATQLAGLFIDKGPIVQVQDSSGHIEVHRDRDSSISYDGPLVVLVDRYSASASEIVASAIQDYQRGLVVGETTFGKGTVQQLVDLNNFGSNEKYKLGHLKATIAQYFRINGGSTQYRGVVPDIDYLTNINSEKYGERALKNALPWSSISSINHHIGPVNEHVINKTNIMHKSRIENDVKFNSLREIMQLDYEYRDKNSITLLEASRKKEYEKFENTRSAHEEILKNTQETLTESDDNEEISDILLDETAHIASDLAEILKSQSSTSFVDRHN